MSSSTNVSDGGMTSRLHVTNGRVSHSQNSVMAI